MNTHRVVIIGAGFGGLHAARALRHAPVEVTVLNGTTDHVFEPLIYQVATGILAPGQVATPVRELLRRQRNAEVLLGWATDVDVDARVVTARTPDGVAFRVPYDTLIVAAGAAQSYFGHDGYAAHAPGLKSVDDALELRGRIFGAFEAAEVTGDRSLLTFVIVGAGPTGVELAGQIAEIARRTLPGEYRRIDPRTARIILLDAVDRVLPHLDPRLSARAERSLRRLGVEVRLGSRVVGVDATGVDIATADGTARIAATTKIWSAGVAAPELARRIASAAGASTDRAGRIRVRPDLTVPGHPEIFAVGDMMSPDGLPGVAQVAMQSGRFAGRTVARRLAGKPAGRFAYFDKGDMATIGRFTAVARVGPLRFSGFLGWLLWLGVHWFYLPRMRNRVSALVSWSVAILGRRRPERTMHSTPQRYAVRS